MRHLLLLLMLLPAVLVTAQNRPIEITGQVVDNQNNRPVEFATVMVAEKGTDQLLTGATTDVDGFFTMETETENIYLEVSFIGFESITITDIVVEAGKVNLGTIVMNSNTQQLDEVVVRAEKSQTQFQLDKRVFNVGQDLSSTGAGALEVLNNVPSVNVSIEGEISLRGSAGVQILINGKPSVLANEQSNALGTITAEMIDRIEVITNPSAKYDAEGTSGIINIVIKKEERKGINGSVSLNTGSPDNHSVGLSLNRRTEKFNLFSQLGVGYREMPNDQERINRSLITNETLFSEGTEFRNETFYNFILGTDYHINPNNVLTLSGSFAYEIEDQPSRTRFLLTDADDEIMREWIREETTEATNPKYRYELQYKNDIKGDEDHTFMLSALGNFFGKDQSSDFSITSLTDAEDFSDQRTATAFQEGKYTFNLDYTRPISEEITLETGAQYVANNVSNDFEVSNLVNGEFITDLNLTNLFEYDQKVLGAYATGAYEADRWGVKVGLRLENTDLSTLLVNTNEVNEINFTNFFPTLHTSYKLTEAFSVQGGYSRRIFRPRLWDLNPFFNIRNNFSIRTGNPNLLPEFTDSYEVSSIYIAGKTSLNFSVYHRFTTDVVERISTFSDNVTTVRPLNIGTNRTTGIEFNAKYTPGKKVTITGDFNYSYFNREGELEETSFDFRADRWSSKVMTKFKLPYDIDFEVTGQYRSGFQTVQGEVSENLFADFGVRKKLLNGRGVVNLSVRDVFASRIRESITQQPDFYLYSFQQRGRFITLGFSYGFGKGEAMEFSGSRRR